MEGTWDCKEPVWHTLRWCIAAVDVVENLLNSLDMACSDSVLDFLGSCSSAVRSLEFELYAQH